MSSCFFFFFSGNGICVAEDQPLVFSPIPFVSTVRDILEIDWVVGRLGGIASRYLSIEMLFENYTELFKSA